MRRTLTILLALVLSVVVAAPASAANLFDRMGADYTDDQRLDPCNYSEKELKQLKAIIPVDLNSYAADFVAAVDDALARRAEGACNKSKPQPQAQATPPPATGAVTPPPPPPAVSGGGTSTPAPSVTPPPAVAQPTPTPSAQPTAAPEIAREEAIEAILTAARTTATANETPFPILALAILAGLFTLAGLLVAALRWLAWEPAWADRLRHAAGEAGWRASSTWAEFADFVRLGR